MTARPGASCRRRPAERGLFLRVFGTLLAVGLLFYLLSQQGWHEIEAALRQIAPWRIIVAMFLMLASRLVVSTRWHVLLRAAGLDITLGRSISLTLAGLFASNFLPTTIGGDLIRLAGAMLLKFDGTICAASLIADRLVGMAGMVMTLPVGIARWLPTLQDVQRVPVILRASVGWLAWLPLGGVLSKWRRDKFRAKLGEIWQKGLRLVRQLIDTLALWLKQPGVILLALAITWIHMLCFFSILALLFEGMNEAISFWLIAGLYSLVYFVTLLPISINGYGVQELSMAVVFSHLGGASMASGITAALLFRTLLMVASLPGAFFVPGILAGRKAQAEQAAELVSAEHVPMNKA